MSTDEYAEAMEHWVEAIAANDKEDTFGEGVVVGYVPVPSYIIRRQDGTEFQWRADMVRVGESIPLSDNRYPVKARKDSHFIVYEGNIQGSIAREAVCYCGAHFVSRQAIMGTVGEYFAAHLRTIRARELTDGKK